jgi:hypothetical protein
VSLLGCVDGRADQRRATAGDSTSIDLAYRWCASLTDNDNGRWKSIRHVPIPTGAGKPYGELQVPACCYRKLKHQPDSERSTPHVPSPSPLPPHQAQQNYFTKKQPLPKYTGHLLHPLTAPSGLSRKGTAALGLIANEVDTGPEFEEENKAVEVAINSRFSLVAIGTAG